MDQINFLGQRHTVHFCYEMEDLGSGVKFESCGAMVGSNIFSNISIISFSIGREEQKELEV